MRLTFRELTLYADGVNATRKEAYRQSIAVAHLTASLMRYPRNKKLPTLQSLLPKAPVKLASVEERKQGFWNAVRMIAKPGELGTAKKGKTK